VSGDTEWRWADPSGQQRLVRIDELLAALAGGVIAPNTPVWRYGWKHWKPAYEVPELTSSALASANGVVPNIPPPPLFMVAVQHDYEDKSGPQPKPEPRTEPPPPPQYVPSVPPERAPIAPTRASMSAATGGRTGALAQPATMAGIGFLPSSPQPERDAPQVNKKAQRSSVPDDAAWDTGKSDPTSGAAAVAPHEGVMDAKTVIDLVALNPIDFDDMPPPSGPSHPTMHGTPVLAQPALPPPPPLRASSLPPSSLPPSSLAPPTLVDGGGAGLNPSYLPKTTLRSANPALSVSSRPPPPLRKRQTLLIYGGAPHGEPAVPTGSADHPSINVPAPGAQAPKAVTQAPPWAENWQDLAPTIPKPGSGHLGPMRPLADSIEEITGAVLLPPEENSADPASAKQDLDDLSASHVIPDATDDDPAPVAAAVPDPSELPTLFKQPAPVATAPVPADPSPEPIAEVPASSPSRRIVHDLSEIWNEPKKRWMVVVGLGGLLVLALGVLALGLSLFRGPPAEAVREAPSASAAPVSSVPAAATPSAEPAPPASTAASVTEPTTTGTSSAPCAIGGGPHVIAPKAQIRIGVEALASQNHLALGFVTGDKDGFAVALESSSLAALSTAKQHAHESIRRVVPVTAPGKAVALAADVERKTDKIQGARTVGGSVPFVLGSAEGKLAWGTHPSDAPHPLWPLEGDGSAEALRAVPFESGGFAVAFRQGAAIYLGVLNADKTPNGALVRVAGLGPQIGSPALATSGKTALVAWADRASASDAWGVRFLEWKRGEPPGDARSFPIPPGGLGEQAMSPGLAGLSGGRFLLAWTEGPVASHQIRAETLGATGEVLGSPMTISAEGVNAGQGQVAVLPDGKGLVVYLASPAGSTAEVVATPIACPASPM